VVVLVKSQLHHQKCHHPEGWDGPFWLSNGKCAFFENTKVVSGAVCDREGGVSLCFSFRCNSVALSEEGLFVCASDSPYKGGHKGVVHIIPTKKNCPVFSRLGDFKPINCRSSHQFLDKVIQ